MSHKTSPSVLSFSYSVYKKTRDTEDLKLPTAAVAEVFGWETKAIAKLASDRKLGFPTPEHLRGRKYYQLGLVLKWLARNVPNDEFGLTPSLLDRAKSYF